MPEKKNTFGNHEFDNLRIIVGLWTIDRLNGTRKSMKEYP